MTKDEINKRFNDTRPDRVKDPKRYLEYGYMEHTRYLVESYVRRTLNMPNLTIEVKHASEIVNNQQFGVFWNSRNKNLQVFYKSRSNERFKERISVAHSD